jgi:hypothetical protein
MHSDAQAFLELSSPRKRKAHTYLAQIALRKWEEFSKSGSVPRSYIESVAGTNQSVDFDLPRKAFDCVIGGLDASEIQKQYGEPICALQDDDWALPEEAVYAYYAIYNLFRKYALSEPIDDWLIVNQSLSSLGSTSDLGWLTLAEAVRQAS